MIAYDQPCARSSSSLPSETTMVSEGMDGTRTPVSDVQQSPAPFTSARRCVTCSRLQSRHRDRRSSMSFHHRRVASRQNQAANAVDFGDFCHRFEGVPARRMPLPLGNMKPWFFIDGSCFWTTYPLMTLWFGSRMERLN